MIYLDHAATSYPKPATVVAAVRDWFENSGVSAHRGAGHRCAEVAARVDAVRAALATLCALPPERIAFTSGATAASNALLHGLIAPGDRVLTTAFEHSAVARPLRRMHAEGAIELEILPPRADGSLPVDDVARALDRAPAAWLVFTHASNVTGLVLDARALCRTAAAAGTATILDASQTAGTRALDVGADALFASAHKSLLGPPGLGFLGVRAGLEPRPWLLGGTGSGGGGTPLDEPPDAWPQRFEPGTPNTPAILGLGAALDALDPSWCDAALDWIDGAREALQQRLAGRITVQSPTAPHDRLPILSLTVEGLDPAEAGALLDGLGIHARAGHHCAPWIHDHLGTREAGTLRLSPGPGCPRDAIETVVAALASA